ncbi:hypothetical protein E0Z10_g5558 [Xylaria hypoxylon]|uniref:2EXR domain-containing protein n=1 Tax=Xylaria hypoxylon TaxID=37992 RepID=A0A4Z0Z0P9_9PEZI|nr:hypothetical protein E0Z10_g5558 [Xylaria hypoxylon]
MSELQVAGPSSPPSSFPLFTRLPPELRSIVWEMAMDEARTIYFIEFPAAHTQRTLTVNNSRFIEVPTFFFVSRECRAIARKQYTETKVKISTSGFFSGISRIRVYMNLHMKKGDRLVFRPLTFSVFFFKPGDQFLNIFGVSQGHAVHRWFKSLPNELVSEIPSWLEIEDTVWEIKSDEQESIRFSYKTPNGEPFCPHEEPEIEVIE